MFFKITLILVIFSCVFFGINNASSCSEFGEKCARDRDCCPNSLNPVYCQPETGSCREMMIAPAANVTCAGFADPCKSDDYWGNCCAGLYCERTDTSATCRNVFKNDPATCKGFDSPCKSDQECCHEGTMWLYCQSGLCKNIMKK
jgi:hypothetical protein